jgi:hypothetical protein
MVSFGHRVKKQVCAYRTAIFVERGTEKISGGIFD